MTSAEQGIYGLDQSVQKRSHIRVDGDLRIDLIDGVRYRQARPVSHDAGHITEIIRDTWDISALPIVQVHLTTTYPGRIRAWGLHHRTVDRLFVASGNVRLVCYDGRRDSPTFGRINEFYFGDRNPVLLLIPTDIYHGWKNVGPTECLIISIPSQLHDHENIDAYEILWDSDEARSLIPYSW